MVLKWSSGGYFTSLWCLFDDLLRYHSIVVRLRLGGVSVIFLWVYCGLLVAFRWFVGGCLLVASWPFDDPLMFLRSFVLVVRGCLSDGFVMVL